jgi:hypothetical protein
MLSYAETKADAPLTKSVVLTCIPLSLFSLTLRDIIDKGQVMSRLGAIGSLYVLIQPHFRWVS